MELLAPLSICARTLQREVYPAAFGAGLAAVYTQHHVSLVSECNVIRGTCGLIDVAPLLTVLGGAFPPGRGGWSDAKLEGLFRTLRQRRQ